MAQLQIQDYKLVIKGELLKVIGVEYLEGRERESPWKLKYSLDIFHNILWNSPLYARSSTGIATLRYINVWEGMLYSRRNGCCAKGKLSSMGRYLRSTCNNAKYEIQ